MPRDGTGNYTLPSADLPVSGQTALASKMNSVLSDIASAMTGSVAADGQTTMTGNLKLGANRVTGLGDGTVTLPAVAFSSSVNTGMYVPAAGQLAFTVGGTQRLLLGATNTLTGDTTVSGTVSASAATAAGHLVTKAQLDAAVAGAVTSFNSRTGAVTLLSSDVTGALGYTPANKAGDTFTGLVTFSPSSGQAVRINQLAGNVGLQLYMTTDTDNADRILEFGTATYGAHIQIRSAAAAWNSGAQSGDFAIISRGTAANTGTITIGNWGDYYLRMASDGQWTFGAASATSTTTVTIKSTAYQYPTSLKIEASTHATSRRASIGLGNWELGQDYSANGTLDFYLYGNSKRIVGVSTSSVTSFYSGARTEPQSVAFSATPTFDAATSNVFYLGAMTANVTSVTINNATDGQTIMIRFGQDATGGRTVTLGASFTVSGSINTAANAVTWLVVTYTSASGKFEGTWTRVS